MCRLEVRCRELSQATADLPIGMRYVSVADGDAYDRYAGEHSMIDMSFPGSRRASWDYGEV